MTESRAHSVSAGSPVYRDKAVSLALLERLLPEVRGLANDYEVLFANGGSAHGSSSGLAEGSWFHSESAASEVGRIAMRHHMPGARKHA